MTIVVHVGIHKTGTTAIQRFAAAHRAELRERGLWYPAYGEFGIPLDHYAHHHLAFALGGENKLSEEGAYDFVQFIDKNRRHNETVLISAEPLYRMLDPDTAGDLPKWNFTGDAYWKSRDGFVAKLRRLFPQDDVEILICLRRQDAFARSLYQERVKVTKYSYGYSQFLENDRGSFDYLSQVKIFAKHFPNIKVLTFENLIGQADLHAAFFKHIGLDISFSDNRPSPNSSLPIEFTEFKRLLNKTKIKPEKAAEIGKKLTHLASKNVLKPARDIDWLPHDDVVAFLSSFEADNERLREDFAPELPGPLFPPIEQSNKRVFRGLTPERSIQIARQFIPE